MHKILILLILMPLSQNIFSQSLSEIEKKIVNYVNLHVSDAEKLLENVVNINSGTLNKEGVKKVGGIFSIEFMKAGFTTEWVLLPDSLHRAGHLVATRKGKNGKKIFIIGHLDTVFKPEMPFTPFTRLNDSNTTG